MSLTKLSADIFSYDNPANPIDNKLDGPNQSNHLGLLSHSNVHRLRRENEGSILATHHASDQSLDRVSLALVSASSSDSINDARPPYVYDPWSLRPYHVSWGNQYEDYRPGAFPGREGDCIFLRSPTPYSVEQRSEKRTKEACSNCRERKSKCSGTRPACSRCIMKGLACQFVSDISSSRDRNGHRGSTLASSQSSAIRLDGSTFVDQSLSPHKTDFSGSKDRVENEICDDIDSRSPLDLVDRYPSAITPSMPSVSSTTSGGGNLNVFAHTNSQTSDLPSCAEGGEAILLPPYAQNSSSCHAYSFHQDDAFTSGVDFHSPLDSTSSTFAPRPLRQNIPSSLFEWDDIYQDHQYETIQPLWADTTTTTSPQYALARDPDFSTSPFQQQGQQHYEFTTSYHSPSLYMSNDGARSARDDSSSYAPYDVYSRTRQLNCDLGG